MELLGEKSQNDEDVVIIPECVTCDLTLCKCWMQDKQVSYGSLDMRGGKFWGGHVLLQDRFLKSSCLNVTPVCLE